MNILCFIDCLGPGGAQRQIATLAVGLKKRGHHVRFLVYHPHDHFLPALASVGIACQIISQRSHVLRAIAVRRALSTGWQDVVLAFLEGPCLYAELAALPSRSWGLVVSERSAKPGLRKGLAAYLRHAHRIADVIVTNSHTNRLMLESGWPKLKKKLTTVYNVVDLDLFSQDKNRQSETVRDPRASCRVVVAASYHWNKNMLNVARALLLLKAQNNLTGVTIDWFGAVQSDPTPFESARQFVQENGIGDAIRFNQATRGIHSEYAQADVVGLFSKFEGLPNAVCEGMASAKPILLSDVCDASNLVKEGKNGFLFDPNSPESIAAAINKVRRAGPGLRSKMGGESRLIAEVLFNSREILTRYEKILAAASCRRSIGVEISWPEHVPSSAIKTADLWMRDDSSNT